MGNLCTTKINEAVMEKIKQPNSWNPFLMHEYIFLLNFRL